MLPPIKSKEASRWRRGFFKKLAKFADLFIERYHLKIEEGLLLAFLIKKGFPEEEGIIRMLKRDHKEAARYLTDLWAAVAVWGKGSHRFKTDYSQYQSLFTADYSA